MKSCLIDTDILSRFFRLEANVVARIQEYLSQYDALNLSIVTYYEIVSGLKYKDANRQLDDFVKFAEQQNILPLTVESTTISGNIYAKLRQSGQLIGEMDTLIAGIALANGLVLVTANESHFRRIEELEVENWSI